MSAFNGEVVIVTGGARGLGRAAALQLGANGARVVVADRSWPEPPEAIAEEIAAAGGQAVTACYSVTDDDGAEAIVATAIDSFGRLDAVINNAGVFGARPIADLSTEEFRSVHDTHLIGSLQVIRHAWPHLIASPVSRIVNITSGGGYYGLPQMQAYSAAKGGIMSLTRALALEGQEHGILVNAVAPAARTGDPEFNRLRKERGEWGYFDMLLDNLGDRDGPEYAAPLYVYLASPACTVTDHFFVAGGARYARVFIGESQGWTAPGGDVPTQEELKVHFAEIDTTVPAFIPASMEESMRINSGNTAGILTI
jgi:NAD(P)-dependent dehydrogenase (short-subunit alcohol dehydrogenase family)